MSTVISNPTPKKRFTDSPANISKHRDMIASGAFERAVDFALLQYQSQLSQIDLVNLNLAASAHLRMVGAQEFIQVLRNLCESVTVQPRVNLDVLNHDA